MLFQRVIMGQMTEMSQRKKQVFALFR